MACFQLFSKEEIHLEEQASALEQMKSLTYKSNFFRFSTFKIWGSIKGFHIRFLVTFITSTFNISSFCIALYLSISFLDNLQIESGNTTFLIITWSYFPNSGDLTAFFLLFSQIYGLYEAIYKVNNPRENIQINQTCTTGIPWLTH